jgi:hypothetical protein
MLTVSSLPLWTICYWILNTRSDNSRHSNNSRPQVRDIKKTLYGSTYVGVCDAGFLRWSPIICHDRLGTNKTRKYHEKRRVIITSSFISLRIMSSQCNATLRRRLSS